MRKSLKLANLFRRYNKRDFIVAEKRKRLDKCQAMLIFVQFVCQNENFKKEDLRETKSPNLSSKSNFISNLT